MTDQYKSEIADQAEVFKLFKRAGLNGKEAFRLHQYIVNMASANLIHRFETRLEALEAKLDAQNTKLDAQNTKLDAQNTKYTLLLWFIGAGTALIAASGFLG